MQATAHHLSRKHTAPAGPPAHKPKSKYGYKHDNFIVDSDEEEEESLADEQADEEDLEDSSGSDGHVNGHSKRAGGRVEDEEASDADLLVSLGAQGAIEPQLLKVGGGSHACLACML